MPVPPFSFLALPDRAPSRRSLLPSSSFQFQGSLQVRDNTLHSPGSIQSHNQTPSLLSLEKLAQSCLLPARPQRSPDQCYNRPFSHRKPTFGAQYRSFDSQFILQVNSAPVDWIEEAYTAVRARKSRSASLCSIYISDPIQPFLIPSLGPLCILAVGEHLFTIFRLTIVY